jgi:uncharacterized protein (TIGR00369 family)
VSGSDDLLARLRKLSKLAQFNNWLDLEITAAEPGIIEMRLRWRDEFGQYNGFLHAGIVCALLDTACGCAAYTLSEGGLLASQFSARFLRPAVAETFVVRGRVVKPGKAQMFAAAELVALEADPAKLLAVGDAILVPV